MKLPWVRRREYDRLKVGYDVLREEVAEQTARGERAEFDLRAVKEERDFLAQHAAEYRDELEQAKRIAANLQSHVDSHGCLTPDPPQPPVAEVDAEPERDPWLYRVADRLRGRS